MASSAQPFHANLAKYSSDKMAKIFVIICNLNDFSLTKEHLHRQKQQNTLGLSSLYLNDSRSRKHLIPFRSDTVQKL